MLYPYAPSIFCGKTQMGKTYKAFKLFDTSPNRSLFINTQWREYSNHAFTKEKDQILTGLKAHRKLIFFPYKETDVYEICDWFMKFHLLNYKTQEPLEIWIDEIDKYSNRYDFDNSIEHLFTKGMQLKLIPIGLTQRLSMTGLNITQNCYTYWIFKLSDRDFDDLETRYKIPKPQANPPRYEYYLYDNDTWYKGDKNGNETVISGTQEPDEDPETEPVPDSPEPENIEVSDVETKPTPGGHESG